VGSVPSQRISMASKCAARPMRLDALPSIRSGAETDRNHARRAGNTHGIPPSPSSLPSVETARYTDGGVQRMPCHARCTRTDPVPWRSTQRGPHSPRRRALFDEYETKRNLKRPRSFALLSPSPLSPPSYIRVTIPFSRDDHRPSGTTWSELSIATARTYLWWLPPVLRLRRLFSPYSGFPSHDLLWAKPSYSAIYRSLEDDAPRLIDFAGVDISLFSSSNMKMAANVLRQWYHPPLHFHCPVTISDRCFPYSRDSSFPSLLSYLADQTGLIISDQATSTSGSPSRN
jgi:hypothetical protein